MKKKLVLATTLLALGVATNVKAEAVLATYPTSGYYGYDDPNRPTGDPRVWGFRTDWEKARDFGVKPIDENSTKIEVKTVPDALVSVTLTRKDSNVSNSLYELNNESVTNTKPKYTLKPTIAGGTGFATFDLENSGIYPKDQNTNITKNEQNKPQNGDTYSVTVTLDGFRLGSDKWTVGESKARNVEEKERDAKAKEQEDRKQKEQETQKAQAEVTVSESTDPLNESAANSQNQNGTEQQSTVDNQSERNSTDQAEIRNSNGKTGISSTDWRTRLSNVWSTFIKYINPVNWFTWS